MSCFWNHNWTDWKDIKLADQHGHIVDAQERRCLDCNMKHRRII